MLGINVKYLHKDKLQRCQWTILLNCILLTKMVFLFTVLQRQRLSRMRDILVCYLIQMLAKVAIFIIASSLSDPLYC